MNHLFRLPKELLLNLRGWVAKRRLHAQTASNLVESVNLLRKQVEELQADMDELRADSRRVAELRIQVEDFLADHA